MSNGCFYVLALEEKGHEYNKTYQFKIGESSHATPAQRLISIRQDHPHYDCHILGYIPLIDNSKTVRLFVESAARFMLSKKDNLTAVSTDYFKLKFTQHPRETLAELAREVIDFITAFCDNNNIEYKNPIAEEQTYSHMTVDDEYFSHYQRVTMISIKSYCQMYHEEYLATLEEMINAGRAYMYIKREFYQTFFPQYLKKNKKSLYEELEELIKNY